MYMDVKLTEDFKNNEFNFEFFGDYKEYQNIRISEDIYNYIKDDIHSLLEIIIIKFKLLGVKGSKKNNLKIKISDLLNPKIKDGFVLLNLSEV